MEDIELSKLIEEIFVIIEKEYGIFLSNEKKDFIENLDCTKFIRKNNKFKTTISLANDYYYTDKNNLGIEELLFMCISVLCGNITPLKTGLILIEVENIASKYDFEIKKLNYQQLEVARIIKNSLLKDLPFNIIFLDSDIEIFNYLRVEKGIRIAKFYYEISLMLKDNNKNIEFNPFEYIEVLKTYNYDTICDHIYNFIEERLI